MSQDIYSENKYAHIATNTTTQVVTGRCLLVGIAVNTTSAGAISVIDGIAGSTVNVASLKASVLEGYYPFNCTMASGIRIITAGASDITIIYRVA